MSARRTSAGLALRALVLSSSLLVGCGQDGTSASVWVEAGHGLTAYEQIDDGDTIEMVLGSQGGWHIDLAARFGGTSPDDHFIIYRVFDDTYTEQISYPIKAFVNADEVTSGGDGTFEQVGIRTVFAIDDPDEVRGRTWIIETEFIVGKEVFVDAHPIMVIDELP